MAEDMSKVANTEGMSEFERGYAVPDCVVLDSAYCSMGRMIAVRACKLAGWTYHDTTTLLELVPECGVTPDDVDAFEAKATAPDADLASLRTSDEYRRIASAYRLAAKRALEQLPNLKGCQVHTSVMLTDVDIHIFKRLGVDLTSEPVLTKKRF